ncbi:MAG: L-2-amino-thiazoline-4-carboxylic acid hydrolase [Vicinamibacterales bacterium]
MADDPESVARLNAVGILTRREIEARVLAPVLDALGREFGRDRVIAVARDAIAGIARDQGRAMAEATGDTSLTAFFAQWEPWTRNGALELRVIDATDTTLAFDVTRCRYAEMYRALGIPELGEVLSCQRDGALIGGFAPDVTFTRTQTLMQGAHCCDFRYSRSSQQPATPASGPSGAAR